MSGSPIRPEHLHSTSDTLDNHDDLAELPEDDPRAGLLDVYDWLTYLQETLVQLHLDDLS